MSKSIPQLTEKLDREDDDLIHIVRDGIDYKQKRSSFFPTSYDTIYSGSLSITTAQVLALNGTPLLLVAAPASGYAIKIVDSACAVTFNTTPYATNTNIDIYTDTATNVQHRITTALNASVSRIAAGTQQAASSAANTQLISGKAIYVYVPTGNPTAGDSDIKIYYSYRIITL